jgi:hypothetical protein
VTTGTIWGLIALFAFFVFLLVLMARLRRRVGGGLGPTFTSDGSVTTSPEGHPTHAAGHSHEMEPTARKID